MRLTKKDLREIANNERRVIAVVDDKQVAVISMDELERLEMSDAALHVLHKHMGGLKKLAQEGDA